MVRMVLSSVRVIQNREFIKFTLPGDSWLLNFLNRKGLAPSALLCASFPEDPTANKDSGQESESIPEYTAEEEREDNRLWRTVVIGEQEQRIDMKVIEPYRRVISHGGSQARCESGKWGMGSHIFFIRKGNEGFLQHDIPKTLLDNQCSGDCKAKYITSYSIELTPESLLWKNNFPM